MEQPNSNNAAAHVNAVNQGEADVGGQNGPITSWQDLFYAGLNRGHATNPTNDKLLVKLGTKILELEPRPQF